MSGAGAASRFRSPSAAQAAGTRGEPRPAPSAPLSSAGLRLNIELGLVTYLLTAMAASAEHGCGGGCFSPVSPRPGGGQAAAPPAAPQSRVLGLARGRQLPWGAFARGAAVPNPRSASSELCFVQLPRSWLLALLSQVGPGSCTAPWALGRCCMG